MALPTVITTNSSITIGTCGSTTTGAAATTGTSSGDSESNDEKSASGTCSLPDAYAELWLELFGPTSGTK